MHRRNPMVPPHQNIIPMSLLHRTGPMTNWRILMDPHSRIIRLHGLSSEYVSSGFDDPILMECLFDPSLHVETVQNRSFYTSVQKWGGWWFWCKFTAIYILSVYIVLYIFNTWISCSIYIYIDYWKFSIAVIVPLSKQVRVWLEQRYWCGTVASLQSIHPSTRLSWSVWLRGLQFTPSQSVWRLQKSRKHWHQLLRNEQPVTFLHPSTPPVWYFPDKKVW